LRSDSKITRGCHQNHLPAVLGTQQKEGIKKFEISLALVVFGLLVGLEQSCGV